MARRDTRRDRIPGFFLGGLFSGSGGNTTSSNTNSTTTYKPNFDPAYLQQLYQGTENAGWLRDQAFTPYDVSNFGDMSNETQQAAWDKMGGFDAGWKPSFDRANEAMAQYDGVNPISAGKPSFDRAFNGPSALQAADPWTQKAGQSWADVSSSYLNPYIHDTVDSANALTTKNYMENILPGLTASYVAAGGGLGSRDYGKDVNWSLTNLNDSIGRTSQAALSDAYNKSAGIFQNDANRFGQLSSTVGGQATSDIGAYTGLGTAQGNNAATGITAGNSRAGTFANLGTQNLSNDLMSTNAQLQAGNQQQEIENWKNNFEYDQFNKGIQWPYMTNSWAADTINKYQYPHGYTSNTQGTTTNTGSSSSSNSPFSSILGGLATIGSLAMPGAGGASVFGNIFGSMGGAAAAGSGMTFKRGGQVAPRRGHFARGGYLGMDSASLPPFSYNPGYFKWMDPAAFSAGGHAPAVKATRRQDRRRMDASRLRDATPQGGLRRPLALPAPPSGFFAGA